MNNSVAIELDFHVSRTERGRKVLKKGPANPQAEGASVPRIARLMALAIRMEEMVRNGEVASYAELARIGHVTRARVSQIVDLLNLAPDLQEHLLLLPPCQRQRDSVAERQMRRILRDPDWAAQRAEWTRQHAGGAHRSARKCGEL